MPIDSRRTSQWILKVIDNAAFPDGKTHIRWLEEIALVSNCKATWDRRPFDVGPGMETCGLYVLACLILPALVSAASPAAIADYEVFHRGVSVMRGRLYVSGDRYRAETRTHIILVDGTRKRQWTVMAPPLGCESHVLTEAVKQASPWMFAKGANERFVGSEVIDGHPTKKYQTVTSGTGQKGYVWRATDLKGFPVQITDEAGELKRAITNVVLRKPDASLFRPPSACRSASRLNATSPSSASE